MEESREKRGRVRIENERLVREAKRLINPSKSNSEPWKVRGGGDIREGRKKTAITISGR